MKTNRDSLLIVSWVGWQIFWFINSFIFFFILITIDFFFFFLCTGISSLVISGKWSIWIVNLFLNEVRRVIHCGLLLFKPSYCKNLRWMTSLKSSRMLRISFCAEDRHTWLKGIMVSRGEIGAWKISRIILACEPLNTLLLPSIKILYIPIVWHHSITWISWIEIDSFLIKVSYFPNLIFYIVTLLFSYCMGSFMCSQVRRLSKSFMTSGIRTNVWFFSSMSPQVSPQIEVKWKALSTLFALIRFFSLNI